MGVPPERLAQQLAEDGQINFAAAEVLRSKAMNVIAERIKVTDTAGHDIDVAAALNGTPTAADEAEAEAEADAAEVGDAEVEA
jgi:trigger factor